MPKRGFTLIELLIVISIIGVLMAIGIAAYGKFLKDGRDTRRQFDLKQIQSSLEHYRADHGYYPSVLENPPSDPVSGDYLYECTKEIELKCFRYRLCAKLESRDQASNCNLEVSSPD